MKLIKIILIVTILLLMVSADLPPAFPSSFWGEVAGAKVGDKITSNFPGYTTVFSWNGKMVYLVSLTGGTEGAPVIFYVNGKKAGMAVYHVGTNQRVDLSIKVTRVDIIKVKRRH